MTSKGAELVKAGILFENERPALEQFYASKGTSIDLINPSELINMVARIQKSRFIDDKGRIDHHEHIWKRLFYAKYNPFNSPLYDTAAEIVEDKREALRGKMTNQEGFIACPVCGSRKTFIVLKQVRSADEPMTQFGSCVNGHNW